jgi:hypothetical protein
MYHRSAHGGSASRATLMCTLAVGALAGCGGAATPSASRHMPPAASRAAPTLRSLTPRDSSVTQLAGRPAGAPPAAHRQRPAVASVVLQDPLGVARGYVSVRNTYRYNDVAGYSAALTATGWTTTGFAARSRPDAAALARVRMAQEVSTVKVVAVRMDGEAPNTATTRYVQVSFTSTLTYRGDGSGRPQRQVWTLRLVQQPHGRWLVDGVPGTG